ncbi:phosphatase PAP2 family protein [Candidatus Uhrbacteria bacterium]|nr:phosphatase PAP2 family protein [Candidatus Uhrbacteria bacterium]
MTLGLEYLVRRPRPFERSAQEPLIRMTFKTPSFPSGHATVSFAIASTMYFFNAELFLWFLAAAVLVSLSRVAVGVHYLSDILVGALIGSMVPWGLLYLAFFVFH